MHGRFFFRPVGTFGVEQSTRFPHKNRHFQQERCPGDRRSRSGVQGEKIRFFANLLAFLEASARTQAQNEGPAGPLRKRRLRTPSMLKIGAGSRSPKVGIFSGGLWRKCRGSYIAGGFKHMPTPHGSHAKRTFSCPYRPSGEP